MERGRGAMITLLFVSFFGLILLRIPVGFALILSSFLVIVVEGLPPTSSRSGCTRA